MNYGVITAREGHVETVPARSGLRHGYGLLGADGSAHTAGPQ